MSRPTTTYDLGAGPPWQNILPPTIDMALAAEVLQVWLRGEHPEVLRSLISTVDHGGTISVRAMPQSHSRPAAFGYRCLGAVCHGMSFDLYADTDPLDRIPPGEIQASSPSPNAPSVLPPVEHGVDGSAN